MTVFEELIVELKEENLLEQTVIDDEPQSALDAGAFDFAEAPDAVFEMPDHLSSSNTGVPVETAQDLFYEIETAGSDDAGANPVLDADVELVGTSPGADESGKKKTKSDSSKQKQQSEKQFFKKRATAEVSTLQMVEHVLTGVEREYLKVIPKAFDDFNAKKALSVYLQTVDAENAAERADAEFALMQETETWCSALAARDQSVPTSSIRMFCENSRPALSSQAMVSMVRFYRNLPHSEPVRSKFDFLITRLFSRSAKGEQRKCLFTRDETLEHINSLYKEWSSIPLYTTDEDESTLLLTALGFEDLAIEAEKTPNLEKLFETDFFGRLKLFKEGMCDMFYAPNVIAAAIESNIRIGNAYVTLIENERAKSDVESIQAKYGDLNDQEVSDAAARTLDLADLLRERPQVIEEYEEEAAEVEQEAAATAVVEQKVKTGFSVSSFIRNLTTNALSVNKWYIVICGLLISATIGLYVFSNYLEAAAPTNSGVQTVNVDGSFMRDYIKSGRISGENFYGLVEPSWDALPKEKREEFLQRALLAAKEKGCKQISLIGADGKMVGFASATRIDAGVH